MPENGNICKAHSGCISDIDHLKTEKTIQTMKDQNVSEDVINKILESLKKENPTGNKIKIEVLKEIEENIKPENNDYIDLALDVFDYIETMKM